MSWCWVPPTASENLPDRTHVPATVVTVSSGKAAVPENEGVSSFASTTTPSRASAVF